MERSERRLFSVVCLLAATLFMADSLGAVTISDRSGAAIYWGGKYVNIKPSGYADALGRRSKVDQMEVIMNDDILTVKISGPYFFNYVHNLKRTQEAPPGDLYISSKGWKVSGNPPYNEDIFEASEGWDYVVSFENKKVYTLNFSTVTMTSALPYVSKYRARQAWRGGYGEAIDDAQVLLTDRGLSFIFSVRNMALHSEIGLHWTMKCGNDIIEGSASIPPIAMARPSGDPVSVETVGADPADALEDGDIIPIPAAAGAPQGILTASSAPGGAGWGYVPALAAAAFPIFSVNSGNSFLPLVPQGPGGPLPSVPVNPTPSQPTTSVPEPGAALLLLAGLVGIFTGRRLI